MRIIYFSVLAIGINLICIDFSYSQGTIKHPKKENIPYINKLKVNAINENPAHLGAMIQEKIKSTRRKINNSQQLYQLGVKQGRETEMLGRVSGLVSDNKGNIYLLDSRKNHVAVYDSSGNFRYTFGKGGPGPGEFRSPVDIEMDSKSNIYIADRYNAIKKFSPVNNKYEYKTTYKIHIVPDQFCILEDNLYVRGIGADKSSPDTEKFKTVHQYSLINKEYITSFGQPYKSESTLTSNQLSDGIIACHENSNTIISTFDLMPYLFAFTSKGEIKWITKINSFVQRPVIEKNANGQPEIALKGTDYPTDSIAGLHTFRDDFFIVQTVSRQRGRNIKPDNVEIDNFLVSTNNGNGSFLKIQSPKWILSNITEEKLYINASLENLYPSIKVYDY